MDSPWSFNPWILGNERSWVLGFNPNPPHYIKMSLVGEIGTSVVTLTGLADLTRENQVFIFSKVFQGVLVICDSI